MHASSPKGFKLEIASPCQADWAAMSGDDRVRFCGLCQKNVYNLSDMNEDEAHQLLAEREGRVCVRFFQREDGTVLTQDCPVGVAALRQKARQMMARAAGACLALLGVAGGASNLFMGSRASHSGCAMNSVGQPEGEVVQGQAPMPVLMGAPPVQVVREVKGDVGPVQPTEPPVKMGEMVAPRPEPRPMMGGIKAPPRPEPILMGKIAAPPTRERIGK